MGNINKIKKNHHYGGMELWKKYGKFIYLWKVALLSVLYILEVTLVFLDQNEMYLFFFGVEEDELFFLNFIYDLWEFPNKDEIKE